MAIMFNIKTIYPYSNELNHPKTNKMLSNTLTSSPMEKVKEKNIYIKCILSHRSKIASNPITHENIFIPSSLTTVDALDAPEHQGPFGTLVECFAS